MHYIILLYVLYYFIVYIYIYNRGHLSIQCFSKTLQIIMVSIRKHCHMATLRSPSKTDTHTVYTHKKIYIIFPDTGKGRLRSPSSRGQRLLFQMPTIICIWYLNMCRNIWINEATHSPSLGFIALIPRQGFPVPQYPDRNYSELIDNYGAKGVIYGELWMYSIYYHKML